jgi:hypothetical protein
MNTVVIKLEQLIAADACQFEIDRFAKEFGAEVTVTPELLREKGRNWQLSWAIDNGLFSALNTTDVDAVAEEMTKLSSAGNLEAAVSQHAPHKCCAGCTFTAVKLIERILAKQFNVHE